MCTRYLLMFPHHPSVFEVPRGLHKLPWILHGQRLTSQEEVVDQWKELAEGVTISEGSANRGSPSIFMVTRCFRTSVDSTGMLFLLSEWLDNQERTQFLTTCIEQLVNHCHNKAVSTHSLLIIALIPQRLQAMSHRRDYRNISWGRDGWCCNLQGTSGIHGLVGPQVT